MFTLNFSFPIMGYFLSWSLRTIIFLPGFLHGMNLLLYLTPKTKFASVSVNSHAVTGWWVTAGINLWQELEAAGKVCTCRMHFIFLVLFGLEWRNPSFAQCVEEERAHILFPVFSPVLKWCLIWQSVRIIDWQKCLTVREKKQS